MKPGRLHLAGWLLLLASPLIGAGCSGLLPAVPRFEAAPCPFHLGAGIIEGKNVRCGYLVVPEDRSQHNGTTIRLAVAIFKAVAPKPAPDPLIYLTGGPGGALLEPLGSTLTATSLAGLAPIRDLILVDQRGTGYSQPALQCPEVTALLSTATSTPPATGQQTVSGAFQQCHDRLVRSGINLSAYTTLEDAADIHDLAKTLGYAQVNLYGVSFGTRLALTVMRLFPADIRSVVLDSTLPPQVNLFTSEQTNLASGFQVLFQGCAHDSACNAVHPHLEDIVYSLVFNLNARPVTFTSTAHATGQSYAVTLNGVGFAHWLYTALARTDLIPYLPGAIYQIRGGDLSPLIETYADVSFATSASLGTNESVMCSEDIAYTSQAEVVAAVQAVPSLLQQTELGVLQGGIANCRVWNVKAVPAVQKMPVTSAIPTLILAGQYDPVTPPANGALAAKTLNRSYVYVFPATGHGVLLSGACAIGMVALFVANPTQAPDASCLAGLHGPTFH
jgi:pimeloyl-ACP methyl ester carboxylesterase